MKKIVKLLSPLTLLLLLFVGCEDDDPDLQVVPLQEDSFELIVPTITNINLNFTLPDNPAFTLSWNDVASSSATYTVEASAEETFASPITLGTTQNRTFTMTVAEFNPVVIGAGGEAFSPFILHMRVSNGAETTATVSYSVSAYTETAPEISGPDSGTEVVLSDLDPTAIALTMEFNDPDFGDGDVVSVDYTLEFALPDNNFETVFTSATTNERSLALTHEEINTIALDLGLTPEEASNAVVRLRAFLETETGIIERYSDAITLSITPYDITLPPTLFVVGAGAVDAGWGWDTPVELQLIGSTYSGNINLQNIGGTENNFRFFTIEGDWNSGQNFPFYEDRGYVIDSNFSNAGDGDNNFAFTGVTGQYFIAIDTENRTITLGDPVIGPNCVLDQWWIVGAGVPDAGWGWETPVQLPCTGNGVYSGIVRLQNNGGADNNFRFFTTEGDWNSGRNYPYFVSEGFTIDSNLVDALDGDNNFAFTGTTGNYVLTIDDANRVITLEPVACDLDQLWLVGAGVPDAGWAWDTPVRLPCAGTGVYSGTVTFQNNSGADNNFRFFTTEGDWNSGLNFPHFEGEGYTIDSDFINAGDGDNNFAFVGTSGSYTLTIDTVNLVITVE